MIKIFLINGKPFVWNAEDALDLRSNHRIVGSLVGCFPRQMFQNSHKWLPLQLLPEEATLLFEKGIANLVSNSKVGEIPDAVNAEYYFNMCEGLCEQQISKFKEIRKKTILEKADVIYEGKKRKLMEKLHQQVQQRKKRKTDDLQNLPLPSSENNNDSQTRSATEAPPYPGSSTVKQGNEGTSALCNIIDIGCDFKGCLSNNNQDFINLKSETVTRIDCEPMDTIIEDSNTLEGGQMGQHSDSTNKKISNEECVESLNTCTETSSELESSEYNSSLMDENKQKCDESNNFPIGNNENFTCKDEEEISNSTKFENVQCLDDGTNKSYSRENSIVILDDSSSCNIEEIQNFSCNDKQEKQILDRCKIGSEDVIKDIDGEKSQDLCENKEICAEKKINFEVHNENSNNGSSTSSFVKKQSGGIAIESNLETTLDKMFDSEVLTEENFADNIEKDSVFSNSSKEQTGSNNVFESTICGQDEISLLLDKEKSVSPILQSDTEQNTCLDSDSNFGVDQSKIEKNAVIEEEMSKIPEMSKDTCMIQLFTECPWKKDIENISSSLQFPKTEHEKLKYAVFKDLWEKGYYLTSGTKFGGDFLAYAGDPLKFHALFVVVCLLATQDFPAIDLVVYGRLGNQVKKTMVLASMDSKKTVEYISLNWASDI